jgi:hypothetical protein
MVVLIVSTSVTDPNFVAILPGMIDYAEQRIYRELDLISTTTRLASTTALSGVNPCVANNRLISFTQGTFVVAEQINIITPASAVSPDAGTRNALTPVSKEFMDTVWTSSAGATVPIYFAPQDDHTFVVGPWPDAAYPVEVVGKIRPAPLSSGNTTTFLTTYLPDLFVAASMVFASGYMRNFGSQADDPKMSQSWENQYQLLKASADAENMRKKFSGSAWSSMSQPTLATPTR